MSAGLVGAAGTPAGESSSLCCLPRRKTVNQVTSPHPFSHVSCNSVITRIDLLKDLHCSKCCRYPKAALRMLLLVSVFGQPEEALTYTITVTHCAASSTTAAPSEDCAESAD